jgi:RNA polymerase sigma-70 factor (ECF subfamily)
MDAQPDFDAGGLFEARYVAFLETIAHLRPRLHRYCAPARPSFQNTMPPAS